MDQFTHAERATDWRGNNNIAESIFAQLALERHPVPEWIVVGAGTGGTSATIGRYVRYRGSPDPAVRPRPGGLGVLPGLAGRRSRAGPARGSRIEGIGRPRVEPSFVGQAIDRMVQVPDAASVGTMREVESVLGRRVGPSTGTNLWAAFGLIAEMRGDRHRPGRSSPCCATPVIATTSTYYDDDWVAEQGWDLQPYRARGARVPGRPAAGRPGRRAGTVGPV